MPVPSSSHRFSIQPDITLNVSNVKVHIYVLKPEDVPPPLCQVTPCIHHTDLRLAWTYTLKGSQNGQTTLITDAPIGAIYLN